MKNMNERLFLSQQQSLNSKNLLMTPKKMSGLMQQWEEHLYITNTIIILPQEFYL